MLAGFLFLLLLTGGSASNYSEQLERFHDQQSNQSFVEGRSTSNYSEHTDLLDDQQKSSQSSEQDGMYSEGNCSYQHLFKYLNLTKNNDLYTMVRPVKHYKVTTWVDIKMVIYGILDVREIDQALVLYVWIYMNWNNYHIRWHPDMFCGLNHVIFPTEAMWKPDLIVEEMTEKDKAPSSPYLSVTYEGWVEYRNDQVLVSTCRMHVYKFPFDIQSCNLSFKSALHCDDEIKFNAILNASKIAEWSHEVMQNQYEWLFINMTVKNKTVNTFGYNQSMIVYTITMRRRSVLYIANFILPILFFLCLDLASFLISDTGGEKLSFKITVLLAVTVMQLILNDILPSSSDRIPLIAVYCIGIFGLMLLSLLETILVRYLMDKDSASEDNEEDEDQSLSEDCGDKQGKANIHKYDRGGKQWTHCACVCDLSSDEPPSELQSVTKKGSSSQLTEESSALEKVSEELRGLERPLTLVCNCRTKKEKPGYWTRVAKTINKVFCIFYITMASVFLVTIFSIWSYAEDE